MTDAEYEILPHQLLQDLKYDVEALKKKLTAPDAKSNELILEIESLKDSIHELNGIFAKALEQTKDEDLGKTVQALNERLQTVVSQNETIAKGMIAISDKLEQFMHSTPKVLPQPQMKHTMGPPQMEGQRMAPPPQPDTDFPPPPPSGSHEKKKLISGIFK